MSQTDTLNLEEFKSSACADVQRLNSTRGGFSVIYSKNGKRITINEREILNHLTKKNTVQISYSERYLAIGDYISESNTDYKLNKSGKNGVIYNANLIFEIIEQYGLDYTGRTSITFPVHEVYEDENGTIVLIDMKPDDTKEVEEAWEDEEIIEEK